MAACLIALIILSSIPARPLATQEPNAKKVLILFRFFHPGEPFTAAVESSVRDHFPGRVTFTTAYLENPRFEEESYQKRLAEAFREGYGREKPDLVIAVDYSTLEFLVQYRDKMFPGVPIVFVGVASNWLEGQETWPGVTGVAYPVGVRGTLELALDLHPDTKAVAIITGTSNWEKYWLAVMQSELRRYHDKVTEIDLIGPPGETVLERIAALPAHTVVFFNLATTLSTTSEIGTFDVLTAASRRVPTYSLLGSNGLGHGSVGGAYYDENKEALITGEIVARVLSGEKPENIPIFYDSPQVQIDWRELRRWHIPESALPAGSVVLYREPSLWERDRKYVLAAIAVIFFQAMLIIGLLWQRARKRKAEAVLRESEERFRVMADSTPSLVWMCNEQGTLTYLNERWVSFIGPDSGDDHGGRLAAHIHPDDRENVKGVFFSALKSPQLFSREYRLCRTDGVYRWMLDVASPRMNGDGSFAGFIGSVSDITDQKSAQEALQTLGGRLLEVQEKERRRIARELHDDISQKLALLSIDLYNVSDRVNGSPEVRKCLEEIQQNCSGIQHDVHSLSHRLHDKTVDYLGIVTGLSTFCKELAQRHHAVIEFRDRNVPTDLPKDISLCLFRVAQEALHNAVKYSGTNQFAVDLTATDNGIQLIVSDEGAGFAVGEVTRIRGLGLVSMQERVRLVGGRFNIKSRPGGGTKIIVSVPLAPGDSGGSADSGSKEIA